MKVYLVETFCVDSDDDYRSIEKVTTTFRGASQFLVDDGFEPYYECFLDSCDIRFYYHDEEGLMSQEARIIEMEVEE